MKAAMKKELKKLGKLSITYIMRKYRLNYHGAGKLFKEVTEEIESLK